MYGRLEYLEVQSKFELQSLTNVDKTVIEYYQKNYL